MSSAKGVVAAWGQLGPESAVGAPGTSRPGSVCGSARQAAGLQALTGTCKVSLQRGLSSRLAR